MAKHKKSSKKKKLDEPNERSPFWAFAFATLLCLAGLFLLVGGFHTGGSLLIGAFGGAYTGFGWAAYLVPVALVYWGIAKFISEDHRLSFGKFMGMFCILLFTAGFLSVTAGKQGSTAGHGGSVGDLFASLTHSALDTVPAAILFLVLTVLAIFFAFAISPKVILSLFTIFRKRPLGEDDLAMLKARAETANFTMNEGVPVEHHTLTPGPVRLTNLRDTAQKLTPAENHE